ncbi:MAG: histidine--tRNA ligase [Candidatus Bathyarchaeia archaeon]
MVEFKPVRGMRDFLPEEARLLRFIENMARQVAKLYGYEEIITPVVEPYELLSAKAGEEVKSRMFAFKDLGERNVALRPEFTASVARLVATTLKNEPKPFRLFSVGTVYRYDEPQKGRYREFWQSNFELMGSAEPEADVEILLATNRLMKKTGLENYAFKIGHVGILRGIFNQEQFEEKTQNAIMQLMDKKQYEDALRLVENSASTKCMQALRQLIELKGENSSEIVKKIRKCVEGYEEAKAATENLEQILKLVRESGCDTKLIVEPGFARGLEYYTGMIFEVNTPPLDIALGGGGRYDKLVELYGGAPTPAVGVAHGLDRIMLALQLQKAQVSDKETSLVVIPVTEELKGVALKISELLRTADITVETEVMGRKMSKALEDADRRKKDYAVIVGEKELKENFVVIRNMKTRQQQTVKIEKLVQTDFKAEKPF